MSALTPAEMAALDMAVNELVLLAESDDARYSRGRDKALDAINKVKAANRGPDRITLRVTAPQLRALIAATSYALAADPECEGDFYGTSPGEWRAMKNVDQELRRKRTEHGLDL